MTADSFTPSSTMIGSARYDDETHELVVTMLSGREYTTPGISPEQWSDFRNAPSAGSWYRTNIMGRP